MTQMQADVDGWTVKNFDADRLSLHLDSSLSATIHVVTQAHLDLAWHWTRDDAVEMIRHTFEGHIELLEKNTELTFQQSQLWSYALLEDLYPDLFERLKRLIENGQWEIVGGGWVEPGANIASGEAIARQYLFGQRYARDRFGKTATVAWAPDDAGHCSSMPQIFAQAGLDSAYLKRPREKFLHMPLTPFWWTGIDGTRLLSFRTLDLADGLPHVSEGVQPTEGMDPLSFLQKEFARKNLKHFWGSLGLGDHGGVNQMPPPIEGKHWKMQYSHPSTFFDAVRREGKELPEVEGELHGSFRATFTTYLPIKDGNREGENGLLTAETLSALAWIEGVTDYPTAELRRTWDRLLFNQFHDIIWGTCRPDSHAHAQCDYNQIHREIFELERRAMIRIGEQVDTRGSGRPVIVFNTLGQNRSGPVEVELDANGFNGQWFVSDGQTEIGGATVLEERSEQRFRCHRVRFMATDVPPMGYKVFYLDSEPERCCKRHVLRHVGVSPWYEIEADPVTGFVRSLIDRKSGQQFVAPGGFFGEWQIWEEGLDFLDYDNTHHAWNLSPTGLVERPEKSAMPMLVEESPLRTTLRLEHHYKKSTFRQDIHLYQTHPLIEVEVTIDYQEMMKLARLQFAANVGDLSDWTGAIHFGSAQRPVDGQEFPTHGWADVSGEHIGLAILSGRYGLSAEGHRLRISTVRCSDFPDPISDRGVSRFVYQLVPHAGDWRKAQVPRCARELQQPMRARAFQPHEGRLPQEKSWFCLDGPECVLTCLKRSEDGEGLVARFYEASGQNSSCDFDFRGRECGVVETNFIEDHSTTPNRSTGWKDQLGPYQIKTLKITS